MKHRNISDPSHIIYLHISCFSTLY